MAKVVEVGNGEVGVLTQAHWLRCPNFDAAGMNGQLSPLSPIQAAPPDGQSLAGALPRLAC